MSDTAIIKKEEYQRAMALHAEIMTNGAVSANALVEMCRGLKEMRDTRLYIQFGFESFDDYSEKMVGMKSRMAYNYISSYEKLGSTVLQSNANLGISKLIAIVQLPALERAEMLNEGKFEGMSVKEIQELVRASREQAEQIDLFKSEVDKLREENISASLENTEMSERIQALSDEAESARKEIETLQSRAVEVAVLEMSEEEKKEIEKDIRKQVEKEFKGKQKATIDKKVATAVKEAEAAAMEKARAEIEMKLSGKIESLEKTIETAQVSRQELEKKVKTSDESSVTAKIYFEAMKDDYSKMIAVIDGMEDEMRSRFKAAVKSALTMFLEDIAKDE